MNRSGSRAAPVIAPHPLSSPRARIAPGPAASSHLTRTINYLRWAVPALLALLGLSYIAWEAVLSDGWPVMSSPVLLGVALLGVVAPLAAYIGLTWALRAEAAMERAEVLKQVLLAERRMEEQTRSCIASDLHDGVQQLIAGALFELQAARYAIARIHEEPGDVAAHVAAGQDLLRRIETGMRDAIYSLRPLTLDSQGLPGALAEAVESFTRIAQIPCDLRISGTPRPLEAETELALFRVVQEALNNVQSHAHAAHANVEIAFAERGLCIEVADDGQGFDVTAASKQVHAHLGLIGMEERVAGVGGAVNIWSRPGQGTRILLTLPLEPPAGTA